MTPLSPDPAPHGGHPNWWARLRPWPKDAPVPRARLLVVPHSGGGPNRYLRLVGGLPEDVEILGLTLPGRERRMAEPPGTTLDEVTGSLATLPGGPVPTVVFGHSLGATLGLHLARALGADCVGFVASGQMPRHRYVPEAGIAGDEHILRMLELGGDLPPEVLKESGWRRTLLNNMRADLILGAEDSERAGGIRLDVPLTVLCGREDLLMDLDALADWGAYTTVLCEVEVFPGGHFALFDPANRDLFVGALERHLAVVPGLADIQRG